MSIERTHYIWKNGEFVSWDEAKCHVLTHGLQYGMCVFEGIRSYSNADNCPVTFRLEDHIQRLHYSAAVYELNLPYSSVDLVAACQEVIRVNALKDAYIRPVVVAPYGELGPGANFASSDVVIAAIPVTKFSYPSGPRAPLNVGVSSWRRPSPGTIPTGVKASGNYLSSRLIALEAGRQGYDDGIGLTYDGYVSEAQAANVFLAIDGKLVTPPVSSGILRGITRDTIIILARELGFDVYEEKITRETLYRAEEVFLTGTACELVSVASIDRIPVKKSEGDMFYALREAYFGLFSGKTDDNWGWLKTVDAL